MLLRLKSLNGLLVLRPFDKSAFTKPIPSDLAAEIYRQKDLSTLLVTAT
jgi:hypothetical protein